MSTYEQDYPDHTRSPDYAHGDERPSNRSGNPDFYDVAAARASRRGFLLGSLAALATGLYGLPAATARSALANSTATAALLGFKPVAIGRDDKVVVPEGYKVQVLAPWGTPLSSTGPAYKPGAVTGADQALQVGTHHDGMHFFPIDGSSTDGLIAVNHE